ncbi:MAG: IS66 family insertion sequence element accessory protein TnpB [Verrucomicrobiota bacterium]
MCQPTWKTIHRGTEGGASEALRSKRDERGALLQGEKPELSDSQALARSRTVQTRPVRRDRRCRYSQRTFERRLAQWTLVGVPLVDRQVRGCVLDTGVEGMLSFSSAIRIFLAVEPVDMRKSFDGLYAVASDRLGENPVEGALFVFSNKRRNRLKILFFDGTGLWVLAKRLEKGGFTWPRGAGTAGGKVRLKSEALSMLLGGIDLKDGMAKAWYER